MSEHVTVYADVEHDDVADTMAVLENLGISYTLVDLTQDGNALQHVEELGFTQTPIVESGTTSRRFAAYGLAGEFVRSNAVCVREPGGTLPIVLVALPMPPSHLGKE